MKTKEFIDKWFETYKEEYGCLIDDIDEEKRLVDEEIKELEDFKKGVIEWQKAQELTREDFKEILSWDYEDGYK